MLSSSDIERLIEEKRREIEREKTALGLTPPEPDLTKNVKQNTYEPSSDVRKQVKFNDSNDKTCNSNEFSEEKENHRETIQKDLDEEIPPGLERYIRRYIGVPIMLKAGEYSPNNPLVRGERAPGDALLGLGEYERRRNTLRKIRQQQYREYLDQQAKKKQEEKQQAERERRERERKEKEREDRERELLEERERYSAERRRSFHHVTEANTGFTNKVDTAVQVDGFTRPLSVAVQTDDNEHFRLSPSPTKSQLTLAERELSPRSAHEWPDQHNQHVQHKHNKHDVDHCARRRSYGDFDERTSSLVQTSSRDKLRAELRHTYRPSIFDAEAIHIRNMQAEQEAAERRQFYQQELKNQILEQQRIREERKTREKMLEQAEMRRLEEQLRMLRMAQEREVGKQREITAAINENTTDYNYKRKELQKEIDLEQQKLFRAISQPNKILIKRNTTTSKSDIEHSKLPFYYPKIQERSNEICEKKPFSINIPDSSIFSSNYDVDSYLRRNLNFNKEKEKPLYEKDTDNMATNLESNNKCVEKVLIHVRPEDRIKVLDRPENHDTSKKTEKSPIVNNNVDNFDTLPIPVLRHSPKRVNDFDNDPKISEAMKKVDFKWKVPAVQKNILKSLPNEEGKSVNILTQLGSIRRQLQLEQLKLDKMMEKDEGV